MAQAAFRAISQALPDLVVMDIQLRGEMNGVEAAREIRHQFNLPVVYLTALTAEVVRSDEFGEPASP